MSAFNAEDREMRRYAGHVWTPQLPEAEYPEPDSTDAEIAYCFFRRFRPARVIEIGSGFSTLLAATALRRNREEGG